MQFFFHRTNQNSICNYSDPLGTEKKKKFTSSENGLRHMGFHLLPTLLLKCKTHIMVESVSWFHNLKIHHYHPHKSKHIPLQNENFLSLSPFFRTLTIKYFNESESEVTQWCLTLCNPVDCSLPGSSSLVFSRQEYWSGLPFPSPVNLPNPGIKPWSPTL